MKLSKPRIAPLHSQDWDEKTAEFMGRFQQPVFNIFRTLSNHPDLMRRWLVFGNHILGKSSLPVRERELLILRIGYLCQAEYEWGQHVLIARKAGISDDEIRAVQSGADAENWSAADALLLRATDELHRDAHIGDATWRGLEQYYSQQQLMDLVFTVGQYNLVSMALNSFGVQPDPGLPTFDICGDT